MARRMSVAVLIGLLLLNGSASIMAASGLSDAMGFHPNPGMEETMNSLVQNAESGFNPGSGTVDTLFGMFAAALDTFSLLAEGVFAAPEMLMNLGIPPWFVLPIFAPMYLVVTLDLIYLGTGRSL